MASRSSSNSLVTPRGSGDKAADAAGERRRSPGLQLNHVVRSVDEQKLPQRAAATIADLRVAVGKANSALGRVDGDTGLVATTQRSISSLGDVGRNASGATRDLDDTFAQIRAAAEAIRQLADQLERDPEMLVKGRPSPRKRSSP